MGGPTITSHPFPKKRFQAAVVAAIDQHAGAIQQIGERVEAQGGVLADLAVDRDAAKQGLVDVRVFANGIEGDLALFTGRSFWQRVRWLFTGK